MVVIAAVAAFTLWPRGSTPITAEEALEDFRDQSEVEDPVEGDAPVPAPGVYRFRATGGESVKLGALPAEDRPYPAEVTAVVVADGDCFTFTLNLLAQHTEETTYCPGEGQELTLREHVKHQQVGALRPEAEMTCDPGLLHELSSPTQELRCSLAMAGGPARLHAQLEGTSTAEVPSRAEVAGEASVRTALWLIGSAPQRKLTRVPARRGRRRARRTLRGPPRDLESMLQISPTGKREVWIRLHAAGLALCALQ